MKQFLKYNGDVRSLAAYKVAVIISIATEEFVARFINSKSRTVDQMQQAARSCKQNIVEGSEAALTSKETEIKLTNVARASLGELLEDYTDYLRFHSLPIWSKDYPRIIKLRQYLRFENFENNYRDLLPRLNAEEYCNLMITLIKQDMFLLDKMIEAQERRFLNEGGIRERMSHARKVAIRNQNNQSPQNNLNNQNNQNPRINQIIQITPRKKN